MLIIPTLPIITMNLQGVVKAKTIINNGNIFITKSLHTVLSYAGREIIHKITLPEYLYDYR